MVVKVVIRYKDREIVIPEAQFGGPNWYDQIQSRAILDLLLPATSKRVLISLSEMTEIVFTYEPDDLEYEAGICGVKPSAA